MKRNNILWLAFILFLFSCGGDDSPNPTPNPNPEPEVSPYLACLPTVAETTLEIITWNIENFPMVSSTIEMVQEIIEDVNPDIIAVQEIKSLSDFDDLVESLEGWSGEAVHFTGSSQRLGYLYKDSEITVLAAPSHLFPETTSENNNAFTSVRRPLHMKIRHTNGLEVDLINVHFKCCGGSENRRRSASELIKGYIDTNLAGANVVFLGDFNDEIVDGDDNVFQNFIDDSDNYLFTTMEIAQGSSSNWSYPSWPSQIDQILISDELFDNEISTNVLKLGDCVSTFSSKVSDHRPVLISLSGQ